MSAAAGRVDEAEAIEAEFVQRRGECAIQDEIDDEVWRLQESIALARRFGDVLVEIAEEARATGRVCEVMAEAAGIGVSGLKEIEDGLGAIAIGTERPQRVV